MRKTILATIFLIAFGWLGGLQGQENADKSTSGSSSFDIKTAKKIEVVDVKARLDLDSYGGSKTLKGKATGWFSAQKINGRWWLVSPDGNGMISLGVVHIGQALLQPLFAASYNSDPAAFYKDATDNMRHWGFNSSGYGTGWKEKALVMMKEMPMMISLEDLLGISRFSKAPERLDLFDEATRAILAKRIAGHVEPVKNSKNLIGYFYVDLPLWWNPAARKKGNDWATAYRKLAAGAPGKVQYVDFLLKRYNTVEAVNKAYGSGAAERAGILDEKNWSNLRPDDSTVLSDDKAFAAVVARQYYKICREEIRKLDPNHLLFGDRYAGTDLPGLEEVLKEAAPYIDVVALQPFDKERFNTELYDKVAESTGKPVLFCDFAVNFATEQYPQGMWGSWPTEDKAADVYAEYLSAAFARPYMIGIHRCTYIDLPRDKILKQGLIQQDGRPYSRTVQRYAEIHKKLYENLYGVERGAEK